MARSAVELALEVYMACSLASIIDPVRLHTDSLDYLVLELSLEQYCYLDAIKGVKEATYIE